MPSTSIAKIAENYDRLQARVKKGAEITKLRSDRMLGAGVAIMGGPLAAAMQAKLKLADGTNHKVLGIPTVAGIGVLCVAAGLTDYVPYGGPVGMLGSGILAYIVGRAVEDRYHPAAK
jgi:hypothetical protein